jgi:hypothetical protein
MYLACPLPAILDDESDEYDSDASSTQKGKAKRKSAKDISWPTFADQTAFEQDAGTKLRHLVKLIKYHLGGDNRPPPRHSATTPGLMEYPDVNPAVDPQARQKLMFYYNFTCMTQTFESVSLFAVDSFHSPCLLISISHFSFSGFPGQRHQSSVYQWYTLCEGTRDCICQIQARSYYSCARRHEHFQHRHQRYRCQYNDSYGM